MADLRVELLVTEDCPHLSRARADLEAVLRKGIIETPIQVVVVGSIEDAELLHFQGSPTIRVNGEDVVPAPQLPVALACRVYRDGEGKLRGWPPVEAIAASVDAHRRGKLEAFRRGEAKLLAEAARRADEEGREGPE